MLAACAAAAAPWLCAVPAAAQVQPYRTNDAGAVEVRGHRPR